MIDDEDRAGPLGPSPWMEHREPGPTSRDVAVTPAIAAAVAAFLASPHAARLDPARSGRDATIACELLNRVRAHSAAWWSLSPRVVADILVEWGPPRTVTAPVEDVLTVLRALVHYGHDRCATHESATARTLALIDALAIYLQTWDGRRHHYPESSPEEDRLGDLVRSVGGGAALLELDDRPVPDEPLALARLSPDVSALAARLSAAVDVALADAPAEIVTLCRRAIVRLGEHAPQVLLRRASEANTAAGVVFAVGQLNGFVGRSPAQWPVKELCERFGAGGPASRGTTLLHELTGRRWDRYAAAGPDLMTSTRRAAIVAERDQLLEVLRRRGVDTTAEALDQLAGQSRWGSSYADSYGYDDSPGCFYLGG